MEGTHLKAPLPTASPKVAMLIRLHKSDETLQ